MSLGEVMRDLRKESNLTQQEMAHASDVHRTYVSLIERDQKVPTLRVFFRLCDAVDEKPSDVIRRIEEDWA